MRHRRPCPIRGGCARFTPRLAESGARSLTGPPWLAGEMLKLGRRVGASTIRRVLKTLKYLRRRNGTPTRPGGGSCIRQRRRCLRWDVFHVDCAVTLQRLYCFFGIEAGSRYVHILGVTVHPDGSWATQQIRDLLMDLGERAAGFRFLVRDRAGQFTASFDAVLADAGIEA